MYFLRFWPLSGVIGNFGFQKRMLLERVLLGGSSGATSSKMISPLRTEEFIELGEKTRISKPAHVELAVLIDSANNTDCVEYVKHHIHQVVVKSDFVKDLDLLKRANLSKKEGSGLPFLNAVLEVGGKEIHDPVNEKVPHDLVIAAFDLLLSEIRSLQIPVYRFF